MGSIPASAFNKAGGRPIDRPIDRLRAISPQFAALVPVGVEVTDFVAPLSLEAPKFVASFDVPQDDGPAQQEGEGREDKPTRCCQSQGC
jgi:hypothetical protein